MKADWPSENIVLGLLAEKPMHGYELAQRVREDQALRAIWRIERSEVYFLLNKLLKVGYIAEGPEERGNGPLRVVYAPTEAGQLCLEQWLCTPEQYPRNLRTALLARIYIALRRDPCAAQKLIDAQRGVLDIWLGQAQQHPSDDELVAVVQEFRAAQVRGMLDALESLRDLAARRAAASELQRMPEA